MKTNIFTLLLFLFPASLIYSQTLSFDNLIFIQKSNEGIVNDFLTEKGWAFIGSDGDTASPTITWAFDYDPNYSSLHNLKTEIRATAWVSQYHFGETNFIVTYRTASQKTLLAIKNKIKLLGMKQIQSKVESRSLKQIFQNKSYTSEIYNRTTDEGKPMYSIVLYRTEDFNLLESIKPENWSNPKYYPSKIKN